MTQTIREQLIAAIDGDEESYEAEELDILGPPTAEKIADALLGLTEVGDKGAVELLASLGVFPTETIKRYRVQVQVTFYGDVEVEAADAAEAMRVAYTSLENSRIDAELDFHYDSGPEAKAMPAPVRVALTDGNLVCHLCDTEKERDEFDAFVSAVNAPGPAHPSELPECDACIRVDQKTAMFALWYGVGQLDASMRTAAEFAATAVGVGRVLASAVSRGRGRLVLTEGPNGIEVKS